MTSPVAGEAGGARAYHDATRHSPRSVRASRHVLDWANKPFPFKVYPEADAVALPREVPVPGLDTLEALARGAVGEAVAPLDLPALTALLFFSAGVTKRKVYPGGETVHFRAAASTGALYEIETYVVAGPVPGLDCGVYHFCPGDFVLRRLRPGDWRGALAGAAGVPAAVRQAPATVVLSAIHWRNTWKYQARAYRHFFWDAGTLLANLLAAAVALTQPARVLLGFADGTVNALLGLDADREGSLALVPLGAGAAAPPAAPPIPPLGLATVPLSAREVDYPLVRAAYRASALSDGAAARAWVAAPPGPSQARPASAPRAAPGPGAAAPGGDRPHQHGPAGQAGRPLGPTILRRGSTRQFAPEPIPAEAWATMLDVALRDPPLDVDDQATPLAVPYALVHAVEGLEPGAYAWDADARALRLLRAGRFRAEGGHLCLGQSLGADAAAVVFFLADLPRLLARYGDRGYRAANLAAGLLGGRLYLAAYSLGLGATGLTFYDDDVVEFFSPDAAGRDALFVTAVGRAERTPARGAPGMVEGRIEPVHPGPAAGQG